MKFSEGGMIAAGCPGHDADFISEHADEMICICQHRAGLTAAEDAKG
jgi:hypothetical protein